MNLEELTKRIAKQYEQSSKEMKIQIGKVLSAEIRLDREPRNNYRS